MIPNSVPPQASDAERLDLQAAHAQIESILVERDEKALQPWTEIARPAARLAGLAGIGNLRIWTTAAAVRGLVKTVIE